MLRPDKTMSKPDDPEGPTDKPPVRPNATIQLDAVNADDIELRDQSVRDLAAATSRSKPPPLPPELPAISAPAPAPAAAPSPVSAAPAPPKGGGMNALYVVGFVVLLVAAIYGGLKFGGVVGSSPAPSAASAAAAPTPTRAVDTSAQPSAATASSAPATITIPTIEVR